MSNDEQHDQQFFDTFMLVLGILVFIAAVIFALARSIGNNTQVAYAPLEPMYQAEVAQRIEPVGRVAIAGETFEEDVPEIPEVEEAKVVLTGPQVYNEACLACHGAGIAGAPKTGVADQWTARVAQGRDVLNDHAINGYTGEAGYMPPKGGRADLSDEEIIAAVDYLLEQIQ